MLNIANHIKGLMILNSENPDDFIAINSLCSAKFPKVIKEDNKTAKGSAIGTIDALVYPRIWAITSSGKPLPTSSSIYRHRNCINSTNKATKKVAIKGPMNDFNRKTSNFFTSYTFWASKIRIFWLVLARIHEIVEKWMNTSIITSEKIRDNEYVINKSPIYLDSKLLLQRIYLGVPKFNSFVFFIIGSKIGYNKSCFSS